MPGFDRKDGTASGAAGLLANRELFSGDNYFDVGNFSAQAIIFLVDEFDIFVAVRLLLEITDHIFGLRFQNADGAVIVLGAPGGVIVELDHRAGLHVP